MKMLSLAFAVWPLLAGGTVLASERGAYGHCNGVTGDQVEVTLSGRVAAIEEESLCGMHGPWQIIKLRDLDGRDLARVVLAPDMVLHRKKMNLAIGDDVTVEGVSSQVGSENYFTAFAIKKGGQKVVLRLHNGLPVWGIHNMKMRGPMGHST